MVCIQIPLLTEINQLKRAVTAVYNRRGYDHASVHAELEEAEVVYRQQ